MILNLRVISLNGYLMCMLSLIWLKNCTVHVVTVRNVLKFSEITYIVKDGSEVIAFPLSSDHGR